MDVIAYVLIPFTLSIERCRHLERANRPIEVANGVRERSTVCKLRTAAGPLSARATKAGRWRSPERILCACSALQEHDLLPSRLIDYIT